MVNDVEALIAEARIANPPWDDELVKGLLEDLADELESANKGARLHAERGNGLAEELDKAYARITELTRHLAIEELVQMDFGGE